MPAIRKSEEPPRMNVDEFLEWAEDKDGKWELHDGIPVRKHDPVKGQSERIRHVNAKAAIYVALLNALKEAGSDCRAVTDGATVNIDEKLSYVPDALVYCGKLADGDAIAVAKPIIIVEVLSPSTAYKDVSTKLADYFKLPSIMHYLIVDPKLQRIQHHYRQNEKIELSLANGHSLALDPPGISMNLTEIFA